jgi:uncharacterized SAM-binding protein YcdF (DUF218 family)
MMRRLVIAFIIAWAAGLLLFYGAIFYDASTPRLYTDAGVVLTGAAGRIQAGLSLQQQGRLKKLLISGVQGSRAKLEQTLGPASPQTTLGFEATNTRDNIEEIKVWAQKEGLTRITLITHDYHMPRSLLLARRYAPHLSCRSYALSAPWTQRLVRGFKEYNKFLFTLFWGHAKAL